MKKNITHIAFVISLFFLNLTDLKAQQSANIFGIYLDVPSEWIIVDNSKKNNTITLGPVTSSAGMYSELFAGSKDLLAVAIGDFVRKQASFAGLDTQKYTDDLVGDKLQVEVNNVGKCLMLSDMGKGLSPSEQGWMMVYVIPFEGKYILLGLYERWLSTAKPLYSTQLIKAKSSMHK